MGQSTQDSHLSSSTMKMFVVLAFAALAAAEPEADPALFYSGLTHGYNSMYNTGVVSPYTYGSSLWRNAIPAVRNCFNSRCVFLQIPTLPWLLCLLPFDSQERG